YAAEGAAAKLGQLEPKVLFAANGYFWNGTAFDRRDQVTDFVARVPSLKAVVGIDNLGAGPLDERIQSTDFASWNNVTPATPRRSSSGSISTLRCGSCIPRAPRASPRASCTATEASSSTTCACSDCIWTCARVTASSGTRIRIG